MDVFFPSRKPGRASAVHVYVGVFQIALCGAHPRDLSLWSSVQRDDRLFCDLSERRVVTNEVGQCVEVDVCWFGE
jgi:hypothetical protein